MHVDRKGKVRHVRAARQTRLHTCHWIGCERQVPPAMWGCRQHWFALPKTIRDAIWRSYRAGQEEDGKVSKEYIDAANAAQDWIKDAILLAGVHEPRWRGE